MRFGAKLKFVRISPTKVRPAIDLVRGKSANEAVQILSFMHNRGAAMLNKLIKSAIANAAMDAEPDDLYVADVRADVGPTVKRPRAGSRGRVNWVRHRHCHLTVVLSDGKGEA